MKVNWRHIGNLGITSALVVSLSVLWPVSALASDVADEAQPSDKSLIGYQQDEKPVAEDEEILTSTEKLHVSDQLQGPDEEESPALSALQTSADLTPFDGDTPFSPFPEDSLLDISPEEAIETFLSSTEDGGYSAKYLSASRFEAVLRYALTFHGWEYVWGGKSPSTSFDCSGLVSHVYGHVLGANMYTNARGIYSGYCSYVSQSDARPGDLVFWYGTYGNDMSAITHVGIYCGNDVVYAAGDPIGFYSVRATKNVLGQTASYIFGRVNSVDNGNVATAAPIGVKYDLVFDNGFYCAYNSSAARYLNDASFGLSNFADKGMANGLRGSLAFDPAYYKNHNSDLRAAFGNDWVKYYEHFIAYGCAEGRQGSAEFNVASYKNRYADLRSAYGNNNQAYVNHFVHYGMREGRKCSDDFVVLNYRNHYPDLQEIFVDDMGAYYGHYLCSGKNEGRTGLDATVLGTSKLNGIDYSGVYDYTHYSAQNGDVVRAFGGDPIGVLRHFVNCGMAEGRRASAAFDVASYYNANPDLRRAFGTNLRSLTMHYVNYGKREGRPATGAPELLGHASSRGGVSYAAVYDGARYASGNGDVKAACTRRVGAVSLLDDQALLAHYVNFGMAEGRRASASFDVASYYNANPDLRRAFGTDLRSLAMHYVNYGSREGRRASGVPELRGFASFYADTDWSSVYDGAHYYAKNADLRSAFLVRAGSLRLFDDIALLRHFVNCGMGEGRKASPSFDISAYRAAYQDLRTAFGSNLKAYYMHYMDYGRHEGRVGR